MRRIMPFALLLALVACAGEDGSGDGAAAAGAGGEVPASSPGEPLDTSGVVMALTGFEGPEAVRYDPGQDVWFVANFGAGEGEPRDGDGFISRVSADGAMEALRFATGPTEAPLHMPRGMFIEGDTLWVADVDGVHGLDRRDGRHLTFIDFTALEPGFLNDVAVDPDGWLYVTDTGRARVYRVPGAGGTPEVVIDSLPAPPNGITWDPEPGAFLLAPWGDGNVIRSLSPTGAVDSVAAVAAGRFDGIERVDGAILVATQTDSSLWLVADGRATRVVRTRGRPADIGYDGQRRRVAVPYIALDRVDVWELPQGVSPARPAGR